MMEAEASSPIEQESLTGFEREAIDLVYDFNNDVPKPVNMAYTGSFEEPSSAAVRDFVENGSDTERKLYVVLGGLFARSGNKPKHETERIIAEMRAEKDPERLMKMVDSHIFGIGDRQREHLHASIGKVLHTAKGLRASFEKAAMEQNPLFAAIAASKHSHDDSQFVDAAAALGWEPGMLISTDTERKEYPKSALLRDLSVFKENGTVPADFQTLLKGIKFADDHEKGIRDKVIAGTATREESDSFVKKYIDPVYQAQTTAYEAATFYHNEAAHAARMIVKGAFDHKNQKNAQPVGDCIPLFIGDGEDGKKEKEDCAQNLRSMVIRAARYYKENDPQMKAIFGRDTNFENDVADQAVTHLINEADPKLISAIRALDNRRITRGDHGRTPSAADEEVLLRVVEDELYNTLMRKMDDYSKIGTGLKEEEDGAVFTLLKDMKVGVRNKTVIDVASNVVADRYNPAKYTGEMRKDLGIARDLYLIQKILVETQNGKMTPLEAKEAMGRLESKMLNEGDKNTIVSGIEIATNAFYDNKQEAFDSGKYNVKKDDTEYVMDVNSSIMERQAREIYKVQYGDTPSSRWLGAVGLAHTKGQDFISCLGSARNATIKTHSPSHEMKGCIDKLIDQYEQDANRLTGMLSGQGSDIMAASGLTALVIIFAIFEKAAAQRLKGMMIRAELERRGKIDFASMAKTPQEKVAREMAIRTTMEKVADEVVDAPFAEKYVSEILWADHELQKSQNPYLRANAKMKDIFSRNGKDKNKMDNKALAGYDVVKSVIESAKIEELASEYKTMIAEEALVLQKKENAYDAAYAETLQNFMNDKQNGPEYARRLSELLAQKSHLMTEGILSGVKTEHGNGNEMEMTKLLEAEVSKAEGVLKIFERELEKMNDEIASIESGFAAGMSKEEGRDRSVVLIADSLSLEAIAKDLRSKIVEMKNGKNAVESVEKVAQHNKPFSVTKGIFDNATDFAKRYGGIVTTPILMGHDLARLDRLSERIVAKNPKYNPKTVGDAIQAIKTTIKTVAVEQTADKGRLNTKAAFMSLYSSFQKQFTNTASIDIQAIKQRNGSIQFLMTDKTAISDLKKLVSNDGSKEVLYDYVSQAILSHDDIERVVQMETASLKDTKEIQDKKEKIWAAYDKSRQYADEYAKKVGISEIGEGRFSTGSSSKNLSNIYSAGLARKDQNGLFAHAFQRREKLVTAGAKA